MPSGMEYERLLYCTVHIWPSITVISFYILYFKIFCFNTIFIYYLTTIFAYTYLLNRSLEYIVTALDIIYVCEPPEDGRQMGPKHVVWEVHNKI
jgi:hypothetical protein